MISFIVDGSPTGKGRPQFSRHGGKVITRTPQKTREYEAWVLECWKKQSGYTFPQGTPLRAVIKGHFAIPKSVSKKRRSGLVGTPYLHRCDADNLAKTILDAISGVAFHDDAEVVELIVTKDYAEMPSVDVVIERLLQE